MAVVGYVGQRGLFNFTLGVDPLPGILVSFGLGIVIQNALQEHYTATDRSIDLGPILTKSIRITDDISIGWFPLLTLGVAVVVLVALQLLFSRTRIGRAFRATADDPQTAQLMGINDRRLYGVAMAIAFARHRSGRVLPRGAHLLLAQLGDGNPAVRLRSGGHRGPRLDLGHLDRGDRAGRGADDGQPGFDRVGPVDRSPGLPARAARPPAGSARRGAVMSFRRGAGVVGIDGRDVTRRRRDHLLRAVPTVGERQHTAHVGGDLLLPVPGADVESAGRLRRAGHRRAAGLRGGGGLHDLRAERATQRRSVHRHRPRRAAGGGACPSLSPCSRSGSKGATSPSGRG